MYGQKIEPFKDIPFDSSYTIVGFAQSHGKEVDTMERFWFVLDNPDDMNRLKKDWVFKQPASSVTYEKVSFDIEVIKDKRLSTGSGLLFPGQAIVTFSQGKWYKFDTTKLIALHAAHPLHYHKEKKAFETFNQYAAYGNSIVHDPRLLFFYEPSLLHEGTFEMICRRTADAASPIFVASDISKELEKFAPRSSFWVGHVLNDSFNIAHRDVVKIVVHCSKALYDKYDGNGRQKGPWQPAPIEITTFWRDDR